jgi:hypothetical protein
LIGSALAICFILSSATILGNTNYYSSAKTSPDICYPVCGGWSHQYDLYDNPSNEGEINNEPSGWQWGPYNCNNGFNQPLTAHPDSGWIFTDWTGSVSGTSNPTNLYVGCPGAYSATANYLDWGAVNYEYYQGSNGGGLNANSPGPGVPENGTWTSACNINNGGYWSGSGSGYSWWLKDCTGSSNGANVIDMAFEETGNLVGNGMVGIELQLVQNTHYSNNWMAAISMNYQNGTGSIIHMGDQWFQNFTASLSTQMNNLQNNIGRIYPGYLFSSHQQFVELGESYAYIFNALGKFISPGLGDTGFGGISVQTIGAMTGQYILSGTCQAAIVFAIVGAPALLDVLAEIGVTWALWDSLAAAGGAVAFGCISY